MSTSVEALALRRQQIVADHLKDERPKSAARGIHHTALLCSDVEQTVRFYQDVLELPLSHVLENRDYPGSTHFFFDLGNGNALAFFDLPGLDLGPYAEVLGGLHHVAISVERKNWERLHDNLTAAGVEHVHESGTSVYFADPDGVRLEIISDPLGEMYGEQVV